MREKIPRRKKDQPTNKSIFFSFYLLAWWFVHCFEVLILKKKKACDMMATSDNEQRLRY